MGHKVTTNSKFTSTSAILRHVVLFEFVPGTGDNQIDEVVQRFSDLTTQVPDIDGFEWGVNCSPEELNDGLTHCFMLSFSSEAARDAYLPHPAHSAFASWVGPMVKTVRVVDYWSRGDES